MKNSNYLYEILSEISTEKNYQITGYSNNYIIEVTNKNKSIFLYGNCFPLNNNASQKISADKSAVYTVLSAKGLPCVEHKIIKHPSFDMGYAYDKLETFLQSNPAGIVVKDNKGSFGRDVFLVRDNKHLKTSINKIFSKNKDIAVSPYIENANEYRLIILDGKLCVAYKKQRPFIVGDGKSTVKKLIKDTYGNFDFELPKTDLNKKPQLNEKFTVGWKNNLCFNSTPQVVTDQKLKNKLKTLAVKVAKTLNLRFCSVDIFEVENSLKVLEVNSIVSMEIFSKASEENYNLTKNIFKSALQKSFETITIS